MKVAHKRYLVHARRLFRKTLGRNRGDWKWIASKPVPLPSLNRSLWRNSEPSSDYYIMLSLSGIISTLGLLANSSAAIIGAMIIALLMGPIEGISFATVLGNRRLLKRASLSLFSGCLLTVLSSALLAHFVGIDIITPEIASRTRPTLIDLGIALSAGSAGAVAKSRRGVGDALPGVAIAVALVPPLSAIGIGIAFLSQQIFLGSGLLFLTNLVAIIFSGSCIFLWQEYGSVERAQRGLSLAFLTLFVLGIPLGISFRRLVIAKTIEVSVRRLIADSDLIEADVSVDSLSIIRRSGIVDIEFV